MSEKSTYGERFLFENPLDKSSVNRSTRNRAKKRRVQDEASRASGTGTCNSDKLPVSAENDEQDSEPRVFREHTSSDASVGAEGFQAVVAEIAGLGLRVH